MRHERGSSVMTAIRGILLALVLATAGVAGCIGGDDPLDETDQPGAEGGDVDYTVPDRRTDLELIEAAELIELPDEDVEIHVRLVRPATDEPVPVIAEFTPYNAPGRAMAVEPQLSDPSGTYVQQFVQRGFAFAFADVRGTADSGGCLDLRGQLDIHDAWHLTETLGTADWSNGKVGFIGASYPGSEAHIAALADNEHLGGVIPVVASTSFYDYHHKDGVPYSNHLTTNAAYTAFATAPTANPQYENWLTRQAYEATECDQPDQLGVALDESGTYDSWWRDRDLNHRIDQVEVPVLMAQGLADWNVKPDHIDPWFNALDTDKTLVAGQWGHQFPDDAEDAYGDWWELAVAFFDETLNNATTGLFDQDRAYVQDTEGTWHTYTDTWPPANATTRTVNLTADGLSLTEAPSGTVSWQATRGNPPSPDGADQIVLESDPLDETLHVSGTPTLNLTVETEAEMVHLVAVLETGSGDTWTRENYGYLNPTYREGLQTPVRVVPHERTPVTIEMYPQEDILEEGDRLRLILRSHDDGATVPAYESGQITALFEGERPAQLSLPVSPLAS